VKYGDDEFELILSGHSLGGAIALVAADEITAEKWTPVSAIITFGSSRVGTWPWRSRFHRRESGRLGKTLREITWRMQNNGLSASPKVPIPPLSASIVAVKRLPAEFRATGVHSMMLESCGSETPVLRWPSV